MTALEREMKKAYNECLAARMEKRNYALIIRLADRYTLLNETYREIQAEKEAAREHDDMFGWVDEMLSKLTVRRA